MTVAADSLSWWLVALVAMSMRLELHCASIIPCFRGLMTATGAETEIGRIGSDSEMVESVDAACKGFAMSFIKCSSFLQTSGLISLSYYVGFPCSDLSKLSYNL